MFSALISARRQSGPGARQRVARPKLSLEFLEDRTVPSHGPGGGSGLISGTPGGPGPQTAVIQNSGGPGPSGGSGTSGGSGGSNGGLVFMSGPGYPLAPSNGPTTTAPTTPTTTVLVPLCGSDDPGIVVGPVVTA